MTAVIITSSLIIGTIAVVTARRTGRPVGGAPIFAGVSVGTIPRRTAGGVV